MSFLGKALSFGKKFLGQAARAGQFIGRVAPNVGALANSAQRFASSSPAQRAAAEIGIDPAVLRGVATGAGFIGRGASLIPQLSEDGKAIGAALANGKRTLGQLYQQAQ